MMLSLLFLSLSVLLCFPVLTFAVEENLIFVLRGQVPEFVPQAIVDIGANKGKWSAFVHRMYPSAPILLLEGDAQHEERLSKFCADKQGIEYQIAVLSESDDATVPWWGGGDTGNSMFRERTEMYKRDVPVSKKTCSLDTLIRKSHLKDKRVDLIKVDVQGAELVVLKGAVETLHHATFVQIEASTVQYNDGGSCTWQVDEFLRSQGYALYDFGDRRYYYPSFKTPGLGQYDILYINTNNLPPKIQNATFCAGTGGGRILPESIVELEQFVDESSSCKHSGFLVLVGLILGYLTCIIQNRFFKRRRIWRDD
jgi:FkbM family methyltransferase